MTQRCAAATSAVLLAVSAVIMVPLDAKSQQTPKFKSGFQAGAAPPATLTPDPELIFEPIQPCRAIATGTSNGGGAIPADTTRSFYVAGTTGFDTQGGTSGGCGVPVSATAVAISLTALATPGGGSGKVIAYPYGNSLPATVALSFAPNIAQTSNVIVGVKQSAISLHAKVSSVQLNGDITGYFAPQMQAYVNSDGSFYSYTSRMLSISHPAVGQYQIFVDRNVNYCAAQATANGTNAAVVANATTSSSTIIIFTYNLNGTPVNASFNVTAHC